MLFFAGEALFLEVFGDSDFYRLPRNTDTITLTREAWQVADELPLGSEVLTPLRAGATLPWRVLDQGT